MKSRLYVGRRHKILQDFCTGKDVLDLGCVDHDVISEQLDRWTHRHLASVARSITGVDILEAEVLKLREQGYHIQVGNVETLGLGRTYDVIVAGELIEHVYNQGLFLESVKRHMHAESILVLTTPNATSLSSFLEVLLFGRLRHVHPTHLLWHDANTIRQLLEAHGFDLQELSFLLDNPLYSPPMSKLIYYMLEVRFALVRIPCAFYKHFAPGLLIVARKKTGAGG
jgi:2-polyprenyl-3-methyl-5-hydroxy-6-metoxy-1,4-benzoquinol methylase